MKRFRHHLSDWTPIERRLSAFSTIVERALLKRSFSLFVHVRFAVIVVAVKRHSPLCQIAFCELPNKVALSLNFLLFHDKFLVAFFR